jgi:hypothetical protein
VHSGATTATFYKDCNFMRLIILILLLTCGCDHYYQARFDVRDSSGNPLSDVMVICDEYRGEKLMNTLHAGKTDKQGKLDFARTGSSKMIFEFRKTGYETKRQEYELYERSDKGVVEYKIRLVEKEEK